MIVAKLINYKRISTQVLGRYSSYFLQHEEMLKQRRNIFILFFCHLSSFAQRAVEIVIISKIDSKSLYKYNIQLYTNIILQLNAIFC